MITEVKGEGRGALEKAGFLPKLAEPRSGGTPDHTQLIVIVLDLGAVEGARRRAGANPRGAIAIALHNQVM